MSFPWRKSWPKVNIKEGENPGNYEDDLGTDILARSGSSIKTNKICKKLVLKIFGFDQILLMRALLIYKFSYALIYLFMHLCIYEVKESGCLTISGTPCISNLVKHIDKKFKNIDFKNMNWCE